MSKCFVGISEKRLNNRRFKKTEEAILRVYLSDEECVSMGKMAKRAGISRSTLYHHHRTINSITIDYKKYVMRKYGRFLKREMRARIGVKSLLLQMILFVLHNKKAFEILFKRDKGDVIREMLGKKKEIIMRYACIRKNNKVFMIYCSEMTELFREWSLDGFSETEIEELFENIVYLTDTIKQRLAKIN